MPDVAFEPNEERLWKRISRELNTYLSGLHQKGALVGASPDEAFYVKCDGETNPFQYFVNHHDKDLVEAVRKGRKSEFEAFHHGDDVPDPQSENTFHDSKLQWNLQKGGKHKILLEYYKALISLRKKIPYELLTTRDRMSVKIFEEQNILFWCV